MIPITNGNDIKLDSITCIVYGAADSGKTRLATTPKQNVLVVDVEDGCLSLKNENIDITKVTSWDEMAEVYRYLSTCDHGYQWVIIDSLSELTEIKLNEEVQIATKQAKKKNKEPDTRACYGAMAVAITKLIRSFRNLNVNVVFTCKLAKTTDKLSGRTYFSPLVEGQKLESLLPHAVDFIFALVTDDAQQPPVTSLITREGGGYFAKSRVDALPPVMQPDLSQIESWISAKESQNGLHTTT